MAGAHSGGRTRGQLYTRSTLAWSTLSWSTVNTAKSLELPDRHHTYPIIIINTSAFMEYWGRAWADYCAAHWLHVHRRKQFTILQLVQLSSVKSSLSFTPYDVYSSQSTLLVGGGDVTNRQRACCRLVSVVRLQRSVVPRPWLHVARACTLTLSTQQAS